MKKKLAITAVLQKWRCSASHDSEVVNQNLVLRLKFSGENPPHRQAENRCGPCKESQHTFKHIWFLPTRKANAENQKSLNFANARQKLNEKRTN